MKSLTTPHVWASLYIKSERTQQSGNAYVMKYTPADTMTIDPGVPDCPFPSMTLKLGLYGSGLGYYVQSPISAKHNGHNWYMTRRFDVWANMPDGRVWHGTLITGGWNETFRMHATKKIWLACEKFAHCRTIYNRRSKVIHVMDKRGKRRCVARVFPKGVVYAHTARDLKAAWFNACAQKAFCGVWPTEIYNPQQEAA